MGSRALRRSLASKFAAQDEAASLAEYALLLGVVAVALVVVVSQYSGSVSSLFTRTTNTMSQVGTDGATSGQSGGTDQSTGTGTGTGTGNGVNGNGAGQGNGQGNNGNGVGNSGNNGNGKKP